MWGIWVGNGGFAAGERWRPELQKRNDCLGSLVWFRFLKFSSSKRFNVEMILFATGLSLVSYQVTFRNNGCQDFSVDQAFNSVFPCFFKLNTGNGLKNVDSSGRLADLES